MHEDKIAKILTKMSDIANKNGLQLIAVILDGTPHSESSMTPIMAWHPNWVREFRTKCENCLRDAAELCKSLALHAIEIAEESTEKHARPN